MLRPRWNKVEIKLYQNCLKVILKSDTDVVSTLRNVKNATSDSVSFSTLKQRWSNAEMLAGIVSLFAY